MLAQRIYLQQSLASFGGRRGSQGRSRAPRADGGNGAPRANQDKAKPFWVKDLEADADMDEDAARVVQDTDGDVDKIRANIREEMDKKRREIWQEKLGAGKQMVVLFREFNPFDLWIWFELYKPPSVSEIGLFKEALRSWFMIGRMGGFNSANMQLTYNAEDDLSFFDYDYGACDTTLESFVHAMGELETNGEWCRVWLDMGTADEGALDVLINMLSSFSSDYMGIKSMYVGGVNEDWPVPRDEGKGTAPSKVSMDPMELHKRVLDEDLDADMDIAKRFEIKDIGGTNGRG
eukprot:evm.model.scf_1587.3 EVM.evm.TU.scf_1587.3   scf_1587:25506-30808(+)